MFSVKLRICTCLISYMIERFKIFCDKQFFCVESTAVTMWTVGAESLSVLGGQARDRRRSSFPAVPHWRPGTTTQAKTVSFDFLLIGRNLEIFCPVNVVGMNRHRSTLLCRLITVVWVMMMTAVHEKSGLCRILFQLGACWKTVLLPGQCSVKKRTTQYGSPVGGIYCWLLPWYSLTKLQVCPSLRPQRLHQTGHIQRVVSDIQWRKPNYDSILTLFLILKKKHAELLWGLL